MSIDSPGKPGIPEISEVGGDFVSLSWDKPTSDGGGKIQGYWIEKREVDSERDWMKCNQNLCQPTIFNVPNLIEDRQYEFRIIAVNEAGPSEPSSNSTAVKVKDPNGSCFVELDVLLAQ